MGYPKDLREHVRLLEEKGRLIRIKRKINKDTGLHTAQLLTAQPLAGSSWLQRSTALRKG